MVMNQDVDRVGTWRERDGGGVEGGGGVGKKEGVEEVVGKEEGGFAERKWPGWGVGIACW